MPKWQRCPLTPRGALVPSNPERQRRQNPYARRRSLGTADLPALYRNCRKVALGRLLVGCVNENKTRRMFYILAVEPVGQNTQKGNYDKVVGYMDALETALGALTIMNRIEYSIAMVADILVAKTTYWDYA